MNHNINQTAIIYKNTKHINDAHKLEIDLRVAIREKRHGKAVVGLLTWNTSKQKMVPAKRPSVECAKCGRVWFISKRGVSNTDLADQIEQCDGGFSRKVSLSELLHACDIKGNAIRSEGLDWRDYGGKTAAYYHDMNKFNGQYQSYLRVRNRLMRRVWDRESVDFTLILSALDTNTRLSLDLSGGTAQANYVPGFYEPLEIFYAMENILLVLENSLCE